MALQTKLISEIVELMNRDIKRLETLQNNIDKTEHSTYSTGYIDGISAGKLMIESSIKIVEAYVKYESDE